MTRTYWCELAWLGGEIPDGPLPFDDIAESVREEIFAEGTFHAAYEPTRAVRTERWLVARARGDSGRKKRNST